MYQLQLIIALLNETRYVKEHEIDIMKPGHVIDTVSQRRNTGEPDRSGQR
jgi:hypothetical protein